MSISDESNVLHRPAQIGDTVRVSFDGPVVRDRIDCDGDATVTVALSIAGCRLEVEVPRELAAVQREIPRDQPRPSARAGR